jgi:hypothetical protein
MSNGIGKNPLNDISQIYLNQVAEGKKKKDDTYLEPDMEKRQKNNEKARKELAKGPQMKNPHFEEKRQEWDSGIVNSLADAYKAMQKEGYGAPGHNPGSGEKSVARAKALMDKKGQRGAPGLDAMMAAKKEHEARRGVKKEGLDPVGKEDSDVNNDGKKDKTDKYLMNRRKAIGSAIKGKMKKEDTDVDKYIETVAKVKEVERENDVQRWIQKESRSSNWRQDLSEIMIDDEDSKPIKEKNVKNKIKINPKLGEAVEGMGGSLIEHIEIDEMDFIIESVYDELLEEGYAEDDVEEAIENAMEATVTFGSDTKPMKKDGSQVGSRRKFLKRKAGEFLQKSKKKVGMAVAQARVDAYNKKREVKQVAGDKARELKISAKRGIKNLAQKVVSRMSEEIVDEAEKPYPYGKVGDKLRKVAGERDAETDLKKKNKLASRFSKIKGEYDLPEAVYGGTPPEKKDTRMVVTNADKKANTPAYRAYKAGNKKYKSADHMNEGDGDPCWDSHKQVGMKKKGGKMVPNCVPKNEEVDHVDEKFSMAANPEKKETPRPTKKAENKKGMSMRSRAVKEVGTQRRQDKETGITEGKKQLPMVKMFRKAGNLGRDGSPEAMERSKKITGVMNKNAERRAAHRERDDAAKDAKAAKKMKMKNEEASMTPQEIALQKKKAMLDRMIAQRRQQGLNKVKKSEAPAKAMGEETECDHSMKGKECPVHGKKDCSSMKEATEDSLRDRRMERGGVGGNQRYNKPISNTPNTFGKKKPTAGGMSALEKVKASIRAKHGYGAIKEDAKMAKQSDEKLAALHKQVSASDQSLPSNQFMMKRVSKEMNRRKKAT